MMRSLASRGKPSRSAVVLDWARAVGREENRKRMAKAIVLGRMGDSDSSFMKTVKSNTLRVGRTYKDNHSGHRGALGKAWQIQWRVCKTVGVVVISAVAARTPPRQPAGRRRYVASAGATMTRFCRCGTSGLGWPRAGICGDAEWHPSAR